MKTVMLVLKIAVSVLLLLLVISFVDIHEMRLKLMTADPFWLTLSLIALACQFVISMLRWHDVCAALRLDMSYRNALSLGLVGQLFNQILPTNLGGDGVRVLAMSRHGWPWTGAARTVLVDRAIGLLFIIGVAAISLLVALVSGQPAIPRGGLILAVVGGLLLTAIVLIAVAAPHAERLKERFAVLRPVAWGLSGLREALTSPRWTAPILAKALLVHLLLVQSFCFLAAALGMEISRELYMLMTLIILASAFPLSFAGWGVREGAAVTGLALIGVGATEAVLIAVLHGVGQIVVGLLGIIWVPFWLFGSRDP
ncbi:MAG: YbhN family protein [Allosphingosinicella sp.]|uniref:lysylphosphatidylglycerol synthase transmembrane domain-containing protein n=1 Tax=Allosphingosinicella sp. TaxID=2823234 RepID=UPI00392F1339